jgi:hypothetical protein
MYQFNENFNHNALFWFKKSLIENMNWALLPTASKAIFPVIACHANKDGKSWPGELTIGILSGLSKAMVRKGIKGLKAFPDITIDAKKRPKRFKVKLPQEAINGKTFPFYQVVLEYGLWRELKPTAKALYPVMRSFAKFDLEVYLDIEGDDEKCYADFDEVYRDRKYDLCDENKNVLVKHAGVHRSSVKGALNDLKRHHLIEWNAEWKLWKVYQKSKAETYWKREFLNEKILKSFRSALT